MKKTKIAVGIVVALGLIWTGGAWYTGKQLEKNMDQLVQNANAQLANLSPDLPLKLSYQDFKRGVFSSTARFVLQAQSQTQDNPFLKPGQSIELSESISHGPFPLAQLKKFNLVPSMASVHTELANNDTVKNLFALTEGKSPLQAETRVSYSGATASDITLLPLDYQNSQTGERYAFNGANLTLDADSKGDQVAFKGDVGSLAVTRKNQLEQPIQFIFNNVEASANTHLTDAGVRIGEQNVSLDKFATHVDGKEALVLQGIKGQSKFDANSEQKIAGNVDYSVDSINVDNKSFGQAKLALKLSQLDAQAMKTFSENYQAQMQKVLEQPGIQENPELYQQAVDQVFAENFPLLLKGGPTLTIAPLSWKNDKGESSFNLDVKFRDPATAQGDAQSIDQVVDRVLSSLDGKLTISQEMATETMKQVAIAEGNPEEQAGKLAEQQVKGMAAMGQMFRLTTQQDNNIVTSLQYNAGQVTMNGEKMSLAQFLTRFMLGGGAGDTDMAP
ncbi:hypothetical protein CIG19_01975 [Enterobacterales bacterium CwR94]|nr:hypothetical protein CIG19_01975 [Enterobacterales bacterium CwR94]